MLTDLNETCVFQPLIIQSQVVNSFNKQQRGVAVIDLMIVVTLLGMIAIYAVLTI